MSGGETQVRGGPRNSGAQGVKNFEIPRFCCNERWLRPAVRRLLLNPAGQLLFSNPVNEGLKGFRAGFRKGGLRRLGHWELLEQV